ncbi:rab protein geranylgeranyltransferase component A [Lichtheimia hyalospora FSU 10163]|nr:rab protein geranylgeranyltransferase component A [Lichtheimia hyalospora FSU 10163]
MATTLEETDFDVIVLGTGLPESITAGALARAGKKVLHIDSSELYGGNWSVYDIKNMLNWVERCNHAPEETEQPNNNNSETTIQYTSNYLANYRHITARVGQDQQEEQEISIQDLEKALSSEFLDSIAPDTLSKQTLAKMFKKSRSYNLDLTPKLLSCKSELVEVLIRSGVGRYLEFKGVDEMCLFQNGKLERVPSSKEDVFNNQAISLIDKRKLMRFLTYAVEYQEKPEVLEGYADKPYDQFLEDKFKISGQLREAIIYAIAIADAHVDTRTALERTQTFVKSMGRFTKGGYLCPLYGGASEIAQAFCRVCAVFGGIYILNQQLASFIMEDGRCTGIVTQDGQKFNSEWIISGIDYLNKQWLPNTDEYESWVSRAVIVSDKPLVSLEEEALCYSVFPPGSAAGNEDAPIYVIHQSAETMACPKGEYVTYLWKVGDVDASSELESAVDLLVPEDGHIKLSVFYQQRCRQVDLDSQNWHLPANVIPCSDPNGSLDFNTASNEATAAFFKCVPPDTPFMPAQEEEPVEDEY